MQNRTILYAWRQTDNYPLTVCKITRKDINAFEKYVEHLKPYINPKK